MLKMYKINQIQKNIIPKPILQDFNPLKHLLNLEYLHQNYFYYDMQTFNDENQFNLQIENLLNYTF
jgi:hypothetical protein